MVKYGGGSDSSNISFGDIQQRGDAYSSSPEKMILVPCEMTELKSEPSKGFVLVGGYKVKTELAPLVMAIFRKHGDIFKGSMFSKESRWCLLELVCDVYKRLEASNIVEMTPSELIPIYRQIRDLQRVKVKVGWLKERLDWISENIETYRTAKAKSVALVCEKKETVEMCERELEEAMAVVKKLQERLQAAKDEQSAAMSVLDKINSLPLVNGLV